jgi:hypothetical protein
MEDSKMASNRKKKKRQQAEAKANGKPNTSVGDAIKKAKSKKHIKEDDPGGQPLPGDVKKTKNQKTTDKAKPVSTPEPKTIIGFGSKEKSTTVHAISNVNQSALCDIRIKDIAFDDNLTAKNVNCSSCKRYSTYKQLLATTTPKVDDEKPTKKDSKKEAEPAVSKKPKITEKQKAIAEESSEMHVLKHLMYAQLKRMENRILKKAFERVKEVLSEKPDFFIIHSNSETYSIVHDKSRLVIVHGLTIREAEKLLPKYLKIEYKWDGQSKMPQEWMTSVKAVFDSLKKSKTRTLKRRGSAKTETPEKRVLKRREKPRKIKRRSRH